MSQAANECTCVLDEFDSRLDYICPACENAADENAAQPCESCGGERGYVSGKLCVMCRNYAEQGKL